jgi:hypothetical protein
MTLIEIRPHRWGWKVFEAPLTQVHCPHSDLHMLDSGVHRPKSGYGGFIDGAPDHAFPINNDLMPFRGGCVGSAEISAGWTWNLYLLSDCFSEARSAGSKKANISGIKRTRGG